MNYLERLGPTLVLIGGFIVLGFVPWLDRQSEEACASAAGLFGCGWWFSLTVTMFVLGLACLFCRRQVYRVIESGGVAACLLAAFIFGLCEKQSPIIPGEDYM